MSDKPDIPKMLEAYDQATQRRIVEYGINRHVALTEGRKKGPVAYRQQAEARKQFILAAARKARKDYPHLTDGGVVAEVEVCLRAQRSRFAFGKGRHLKTRTIHDYLQKAGFFTPAESS